MYTTRNIIDQRISSRAKKRGVPSQTQPDTMVKIQPHCRPTILYVLTQGPRHLSSSKPRKAIPLAQTQNSGIFRAFLCSFFWTAELLGTDPAKCHTVCTFEGFAPKKPSENHIPFRDPLYHIRGKSAAILSITLIVPVFWSKPPYF